MVRHTLDTNWDRLEHVANYDLLTRLILGIHINLWEAEKKEFSYQTIIDNVSLIDEQLLNQINLIVVEYGQTLLKKKKKKKHLLSKPIAMPWKPMFIFQQI